jgi:hypothetical protein
MTSSLQIVTINIPNEVTNMKNKHALLNKNACPQVSHTVQGQLNVMWQEGLKHRTLSLH